MVAILYRYAPDRLLAAYITMIIADILVPNRHHDTSGLSKQKDVVVQYMKSYRWD